MPLLPQQGGLCEGSLHAVLWTRLYLPADQLGYQFCLTTGADEVPSVSLCSKLCCHVSPKPTPHVSAQDLATMGMPQHLPCSSSRGLGRAHAGGWHSTRHPASEIGKGCLGQMDMPKLTAPILGLVPQSCAPLPAHHGHLLPWLQLEPVHPATVLWHG